MELRRVDPRTLKHNPSSPRKIQPGELSDAALAASIDAVGILQPPAVTDKDGELTIAYGARRVRVSRSAFRDRRSGQGSGRQRPHARRQRECRARADGDR